MRVKLVRSGGIAGLDIVATVDTVDLPTDQQSLVDRLLSSDLRDPATDRPQGADQFSYQLEIHHSEGTVRRQWDGPDVPETVRPLLTELTRQARPV